MSDDGLEGQVVSRAAELAVDIALSDLSFSCLSRNDITFSSFCRKKIQEPLKEHSDWKKIFLADASVRVGEYKNSVAYKNRNMVQKKGVSERLERTGPYFFAHAQWEKEYDQSTLNTQQF